MPRHVGRNIGGRGVRILIRQDNTGDYLHNSGTWISERDEALAFEHGADAVNHCIHNQLQGIHLRYCSSDPEFDFSISPFNVKLAA